MSVQISATFPLIGGICSMMVAQVAGVNDQWTLIGIAIGVTIVGTAAWVYSPLPNHNGGFFAAPARWQKWGWTSEPAEGQPEPRMAEVMAWRPSGILGIYWASNQPEEEGDAE